MKLLITGSSGQIGTNLGLHLQELGQVTSEEAEQIERDTQDELERQLEEARAEDDIEQPSTLGGVWQGYYGGPERPDDERKSDRFVDDYRWRPDRQQLGRQPGSLPGQPEYRCADGDIRESAVRASLGSLRS